MNDKALFKITYGLYVLTAKDGDKDNGCIINTLQQVTNTPNRIAVTVNKQNYTHDMIKKTGEFNVSMIDETAKFDLFKNFGFQSGKDVDKLAGINAKRADNEITFILDGTSAFIGGKVIKEVDLDTHTMFIADITAMEVLSDVNSVTYNFYQANIKPAPETKKKGWVCKICGYVYEGDPLPEDFICPICKHGASDFEKLV